MAWLIIVAIYTLALVPLLFFLTNRLHNKIPTPIVQLYVLGFLLTALGWEIWWTFGLVPPAQGVNERRCPDNPESCIQNKLLPQSINWIMTSLYDAAIVCVLGLVFVLKLYGTTEVMEAWLWKVFWIYFVWFVGQNLIVELMIAGQISGEETIVSWAPLSPIGPAWNPSVTVGNAKLTLQNQIPWALMTPLFYGCCIWIYKRHRQEGGGKEEKKTEHPQAAAAAAEAEELSE